MKIPQAVHDFVAGNYSTTIAESNAVGGGCISSTQRISLSNGTELLLKVNPPIRGLFRAEANGLLEIAKSKTIKVPHVLAHDEDFLLTEFIQSSRGAVSSGFFEAFGRELAALHSSISSGFGFYEDNFIGSTPQKNTGAPADWKWADFFVHYRLEFQLEQLESGGKSTPELRSVFAKAISTIYSLLLDYNEPPSLLHGDLWSGNYVAGADGKAALIDPAVYYGDREAELAMTTLFGGFPETFYSAYNERYPLRPGWRDRRDAYQLYHVMNHLNLFGSSYYSHALSLLRRYQ